ncbi:MAG: hypothetical protein JJU36_03745 [Phycisphaeraceae bacterium]|nr:hypothetical protein [Phycisphaeraceae bacterium]
MIVRACNSLGPAPIADFRRRGVALLASVLLLLLGGCQTGMRHAPADLMRQGEYGKVRAQLGRQLTENRRDRSWMIDRMRLAVLAMADGRPDQAQVLFEEVEEILRTQGINRDRTVAAMITWEGVRFWKGEPFEQALALFYYALQQGSLEQWDNVRAASGSSLFRLRDFGYDPRSGRRHDAVSIARHAVELEQRTAPDEDGDFFNTGYAVVDSNFIPGYILHGVASRLLNRPEEAADYFAAAASLDSRLEPLLREFRDTDYNTVLVVSYGLGPAKARYGPDEAFTWFVPRTSSDDAPLVVRFTAADDWAVAMDDSPRVQQAVVPRVMDINRMASDHKWNNWEDVRRAKSALGNVMLTAGAATTLIGAQHRSNEAVFIGLGLMAAGIISRAGAQADTRYADVFPQRFYMIPLQVTGPLDTIELQVDGQPGSRMVLRGLSPPEDEQGVQLRYVRLNQPIRGQVPPSWAVSGRINYRNEVAPMIPEPGPAAGDDLARPFVIGGVDVRPPGGTQLRELHASGRLSHTPLGTFQSAFYEERLIVEPSDAPLHPAEPHVLEGGRMHTSPLAGTAGFARLFGQVHAPYQPRSGAMRGLMSQWRAAEPHAPQEHAGPIASRDDRLDPGSARSPRTNSSP